MRPRGHPPAPRDKGESSLRRYFAFGALCLAPLLFCGCSAASSTWTRLVNQFNFSSGTNSAPSPSVVESSSPASPGSAPEEKAAPTPIPKKKARAYAMHRSAPAAASSNSVMAEPQLQDANGNYQISSVETGVPSAETPAANASPTIALGAHPASSPSQSAESRFAPTTDRSDTSAPAATPTSSAPPGNESIQAKAERMIRTVNTTAKEIDRSSLSASETSRYSLATKLIRSAEKTMTEFDYAAAASLAKKAIDLLAPLPRLPQSKSSDR